MLQCRAGPVRCAGDISTHAGFPH